MTWQLGLYAGLAFVLAVLALCGVVWWRFRASAALPIARPAERVTDVGPGGFNELRQCRSGPMLFNKHDIYLGRSLQKYGEYSWFELEMFEQFVSQGSVVVEVGANIGAHTIPLSKLVGSEGRVFAFEPQRIVFQALCANLALNHCTNVYAEQSAIGAEPGKIIVPATDPNSAGNFGGISLIATGKGESVRLQRLDDIDVPACRLLKIDVEGMECEVLKGARHTIGRFRPILYLENDRESRSAELIELIQGMDYDIYWHLPPLYNPGNFANDSENLFPGIVSINILCVPSEAKSSINGLRRVTSARDTWRITTSGSQEQALPVTG